jgi:hypothetical protein
MADKRDVTPAGIAGGQGRTSQDVEDSALIGASLVAAFAAFFVLVLVLVLVLRLFGVR